LHGYPGANLVRTEYHLPSEPPRMTVEILLGALEMVHVDLCDSVRVEVAICVGVSRVA